MATGAPCDRLLEDRSEIGVRWFAQVATLRGTRGARRQEGGGAASIARRRQTSAAAFGGLIAALGCY